MANPIAIIPLLCLAQRGTCTERDLPRALLPLGGRDNSQGHSPAQPVQPSRRHRPLWGCSTALTSEAMGKGPRAAMQVMHKPTMSQQLSKATSSSTKGPQDGETSTFQFPRHCLLKPTHKRQRHGALPNNWKAPKYLNSIIHWRKKKTLHRHRREARRSLGNLLRSTLSEILQGMEKKLFVLISIQESIACNSVCGHAGLGSKSRMHLWLLAPAQRVERGGWKSSNVNDNSGCPNKHLLAVTEAYQKAA